jgi:lipopolysaccharide/colanic/teichoic acid biosynthesis glycosyltransferase
MKRIFDIILSFVGFLVLSPLFIIIALVIKFHDGGTVFYMAPRVGKNGRTFKMFKFRTMVVNADKIGASSTTTTDSRITPIGRFLRKTKLDELSQLINVMKGDMSLVGPRPDVKKFTDLFTEEESRILSIKPGITDFASLWNSDEGKILEGSADPDKTYMELIWPEKKRLQLKYVNEQSFVTDMRIIFKTIKAVIFGNQN